MKCELHSFPILAAYKAECGGFDVSSPESRLENQQMMRRTLSVCPKGPCSPGEEFPMAGWRAGLCLGKRKLMTLNQEDKPVHLGSA